MIGEKSIGELIVDFMVRFFLFVVWGVEFGFILFSGFFCVLGFGVCGEEMVGNMMVGKVIGSVWVLVVGLKGGLCV